MIQIRRNSNCIKYDMDFIEITKSVAYMCRDMQYLLTYKLISAKFTNGDFDEIHTHI